MEPRDEAITAEYVHNRLTAETPVPQSPWVNDEKPSAASPRACGISNRLLEPGGSENTIAARGSDKPMKYSWSVSLMTLEQTLLWSSFHEGRLEFDRLRS